MQRIEIELELALVLHSRSYQETSLLVEVFCREHGRFTVVAKGAKRPKARARGLLEPFVPLLISCSGRGELLTLKSFESSGPSIILRGRLLISGIYINELLMRLLHRFDPHPELFDIYRDTLTLLAQENTPSQEQIILRLFEKSLLKSIGYDLPLITEAHSQNPVRPEAWYIFNPMVGPTVMQEGQRDIAGRQKLIIVSGKSLIALHTGQLVESSALLDAKRLMRAALRLHLGDRPLQSRRLVY